MPEKTPPTLLILLTDDASGGRVAVSLEAFMEYTDHLIDDLEKLETRWRSTASPAALQRAAGRPSTAP